MEKPLYEQTNLTLTRVLHFIIGFVPLIIGLIVALGLPWFWYHDLAMVPENVRPYVIVITFGIILGGWAFIAVVVRQFWLTPVSNLRLWRHRAVIEHSTPFRRSFEWIERGDLLQADVVSEPWMEGMETFHIVLRFINGDTEEVGGKMTVRAEASRLAGLLERELTDPLTFDDQTIPAATGGR
ncbi:hypothetical protein [Notoacmeibacter ruber]|uniref:Uncharacterized protein n=1 Tax=Notoacmeibacter ruber TaxID=2670375 RepID=A0A3L7JAV3_9HYPH|nr:hypothetical protein [Notoacmeibacter ruber]RLQ87495.1 hypothetical protein D8780_04020 [Notoacmeibacter ruber]